MVPHIISHIVSCKLLFWDANPSNWSVENSHISHTAAPAMENIIENNIGIYLLNELSIFPLLTCKNNIYPINPIISPDNKCNILSYIGIII